MKQEREEHVEKGMVTFPRKHQKEFIVAVVNATRICPTEVLRSERPKMKKKKKQDFIFIFELDRK